MTTALTAKETWSATPRLTTARRSFLRHHVEEHVRPKIDPTEKEPIAHEGDPAHDILSLLEVRKSIEEAWKAQLRRAPDRKGRLQFRRRLFALTPPERFFYSYAQVNLYRPVEIVCTQDRDEKAADLSQRVRDLTDENDPTGILLIAGSGKGKTVACWKAYFDCFFPYRLEENERPPLLEEYVPVWIRAREQDPLFDEFRSAGSENGKADSSETLEEQLKRVDRRLIWKLLARFTPRLSPDRVETYLKYGPRLLLFFDLNHFGAIERRVISHALESFQREYGDRHRCVVTYRSAHADDPVLRQLLVNERFRQYDLEVLSEDAAVSYLEAYRHFERAVYEGLNAVEDDNLPNLSVPERDISEECSQLRQLIRRTVRVDPQMKRESDSAVSTPLIMHFVSLLGEDELRRVRNVTHLFRRVKRRYLDRERELKSLPAGLSDEKILTGMTRIALAILAQGDQLTIPLDRASAILRNPSLGKPGRKGAQQPPWWPTDPFWHAGTYYTETYEPHEIEAVFAAGLFRSDGDTLRFIHDSFVYDLAGAVALREYERPGVPSEEDGVDAEWVGQTANLLSSAMGKWKLAAEFLGGALLSERDPSPHVQPAVSELGRQLVVPLVVQQRGAEHVELLSRFVCGQVDDSLLRDVEHGILAYGSFLHAHPNSVLQQVYNYLHWSGADGDSAGLLADELLRSYRSRPQADRFDWLRIDRGPRRARVLTMSEHQGNVNSVAVLAEGLIVSGSSDHTVKLWDVVNGQVRTLGEHQSRVTTVKVTDSGCIVSGGRDGIVKLWNLTSGDVQIMDQHEGEVWSIDVLGDGRIVSGSLDSTVKVWDPRSGGVKTMDQHRGSIRSVAVMQNGCVASGSDDHSVKLWDVDNGRILSMEVHQRRVTNVAALADGRVVSGSDDGKLKLWNPTTGEIAVMNQHQGSVSCLEVLADGHIVSASSDGTLILWDPVQGDVTSMEQHTERVESLAALSDGRIVSGSWDHTVRIWNPADGHVMKMDQHQDRVLCVEVYSDGRIASGSMDDTVKLWDPTNEQIQSTKAHERWVGCVVVSPDERIVSGSWDHTVKVLNLDGREIKSMNEHQGAVVCVAVLSDGRIASGSWDHTIKLWNPVTDEVVTIGQHDGAVVSVAVLPDDRIVSGSGDRTVKIWDWRNEVVRSMNEHQGPVLSVAVLPCGRIVSGGDDRVIKLWDPNAGSVQTIGIHQDIVTCVAARQDGQIVSGSWDNTVKLWNPINGTAVSMDQHQHRVRNVAVLSDQRVVSCSNDHMVKLWDPSAGTALTPPRPAPDPPGRSATCPPHSTDDASSASSSWPRSSFLVCETAILTSPLSQFR